MKQRTLKLQRIYKEGSAYLESRQIPDAQIDAWYLLEYVTGISRASYYGNPEKNISEEEDRKSTRLNSSHSSRSRMPSSA